MLSEKIHLEIRSELFFYKLLSENILFIIQDFFLEEEYLLHNLYDGDSEQSSIQQLKYKYQFQTSS